MISVQYIARRNLTILGKTYSPGDPVMDPDISDSTIRTLLNTRKLGQKVARTGDGQVVSDAPDEAAPVAAAPVQETPVGDLLAEPVQEAKEAPPGVTMASLRKSWDASGTDDTFRQWLQEQCAARGLAVWGSVKDIVARLERAET